MSTLLAASAFIAAAALVRHSVVSAARRAAAWEDACRARLRDRQWAAVEAQWTDEVLRRR
ncbi:hypothetical protein ACQEVB_17195 [Pseudonocardia sp. CA-107938]|uniref:hypothetical protein n=1 Tax=Pseudonocardia sp. CA-107938 TaxID=3240021 RepID=UPI003D913FD2